MSAGPGSLALYDTLWQRLLLSQAFFKATPYLIFSKASPHLIFLSDLSSIIGNACHSLTHLLTNSLTDSRLVNLIDATLACEDANSKLFLLRMLKLRIMLATFVADLGTKV